MAGIKNNGKVKYVFMVPKEHSQTLTSLAASRKVSKGGRLEMLLNNAIRYERDKDAAKNTLSNPISTRQGKPVTIGDLYTMDFSIVEMPVYSDKDLKQMAISIVGSKDEAKIGAFVSALITNAYAEYWEKLTRDR